MKIAIGVCEKINGTCSTMGCFRAFNNRDKHFAIYKDKDVKLMTFFSCNMCSSNSNENLTKIAEKLVQEGITKLHLGKCAVKCKAGKLEEIKSIFEKRNIEVIEGTH